MANVNRVAAAAPIVPVHRESGKIATACPVMMPLMAAVTRSGKAGP